MSIIDLFILLLTNRWLIIKNVVIAIILSVILSLILPNWYKATAEIIPINNESGGISSLLAGYSLNMVGKDAISPESYRIILNSQSVKDSLITKFDLFNRYQKSYKEEIYKEIEENIEVEIEKESGFGFEPIIGIFVSVIDKDPQIASKMTNFYIAFLDSTLKNMNQIYTQKKFKYIEKRYNRNIKDIDNVQNQMQNFQENYGILNLNKQMEVSIEMIAELEVEREKLSIQIDALSSMTRNNSKIIMLQNEISSINNKIEEYAKGLSKPGRMSIIPPLNEIPEISNEYLSIYRESRIQSRLFEMLSIEYEQSRMQLEKEIPSFLILSPASIPTYKFKPKRSILVITITLLILLFTIFYVIIQNFIMNEKHMDTEKYRKLNEIFELVKSDFRKKR